jgi:hypothetical protein
MSNQEQEINYGAGAEMSIEHQQQFKRSGKRRNCFFVPGSSDPNVAQKFSDSLYKECFGEKNQE